MTNRRVERSRTRRATDTAIGVAVVLAASLSVTACGESQDPVGSSAADTTGTDSSQPSGPSTTKRPSTGTGSNTGADRATIERVVDGDTVELRIEGAQERVRLLGINTPESVDPDRPVMCFGREAGDELKRLLPKGTEVRVVRDAEPRDRFGRLLLYLYVDNDQGGETFVNLHQLQSGFANTFILEPNTAHAAEFRAAAGEARRARRGLWGACPKPFEE